MTFKIINLTFTTERYFKLLKCSYKVNAERNRKPITVVVMSEIPFVSF